LGGNEKVSQNQRLRALEEKKSLQNQRGLNERMQMERISQKKFSIWAVGQGLKTFFNMNEASRISSFQVSLSRSIPIYEIRERMEKAFGDL
jgi:hypothetical protein